MNLNLVEKELEETFVGHKVEFGREFAVLDFDIDNVTGHIIQRFDDEFNKTTVYVNLYDRETYDEFQSSEKELNLEQVKEEIRKRLR